MRKTHIVRLFLEKDIEWLKRERKQIERVYWELCKNFHDHWDKEKILDTIANEQKKLGIIDAYIEELEKILAEDKE